MFNKPTITEAVSSALTHGDNGKRADAAANGNASLLRSLGQSSSDADAQANKNAYDPMAISNWKK